MFIHHLLSDIHFFSILNKIIIMGKYRVKYKMKGQSWKETTIEASNGQEAQKNVKSMMGSECENTSAGILIR